MLLLFLLCLYNVMVRGEVRSSSHGHHSKEGSTGKGMDYGNRSTRNARVKVKVHNRHDDSHNHSHHVHRKAHKGYGGSIKPHNENHARILRNMVGTHGNSLENLTHEEKDLANMAAHGNLDALDMLYNDGAITPDVAEDVGGSMLGSPIAEPVNQVDPVPSPLGLTPEIPQNVAEPPDYSSPEEAYVSGGVATGRTNKEQAEIDALAQNESPIDDKIPVDAYSSLVSMGHSAPVAKGVADEVRDANAEKALRVKRAYDISQPPLNPGYIPQVNLAKATNAKDVVSDADKAMLQRKVYEEYTEKGSPTERAEFEAHQAGFMIDKYNEGLSKGLSPEVAYGRAVSLTDLNYQHAVRSAAIAGGGHVAAQSAADRSMIEEMNAREMAQTPSGLRPKVLEKKQEEINEKRLNRAQDLSSYLTKKHITEPIRRALQKLNQAETLKDLASMEGLGNPVVQERILTDVATSSAEDLAKAQQNLENSRAQLKPNGRKTNALNFLSKVSTERAIQNMNRKNEEMQNKAIQIQKEANENNAVKTAEEHLAKAAEQQIIKNEGKSAFAKVLENTGDVLQAGKAREEAESAAAEALNQQREARKAEVMKMLGPMGMNDSVKEAVDHMATAHAGLNVVGSDLEELSKKYEEEMAHQSNIEALLKETATSNLDVKEIIPPTTSRVGITEGKMKLPLKGFSNEEPKTEEEIIVQSRQKNRRNQVRNKVIGTPVESGLNVIDMENGFMHISEAAKALKINKGKIFYPESAKGLMDKQKLNTSLLEHKYNTGERPNLDKGVGYYEADASGFTLPLPSPLDPVPTSTMTNGEKSLNIGQASELDIEDGELLQTPWNEFVKSMRPSINGRLAHESEVAAASEMKSRVDDEKKAKNLEGISTEIYTNPDGSKFVEVSSPYGVPEIMTMDQAVESLNNVGPSSVGAVSEEIKKKTPDVPLDMAVTDSVKGSEESFISEILSKIRKTGNGKALAKKNAFNGKVDGEKAGIVDEYNKELINDYMSSSSTVESQIRNNIIRKAESYAKGMNISTETFLNMISQLPESAIKEMVSYNQTPPNARKDITETQFYSQIAGILPDGNTSIGSITEMIFNNISTVTHQPNTVGGEILEQMTVPNLKAIEQIETKKTPTGTTQVSVSVPNDPRKVQVLGEVKFKGNPTQTAANGRPISGSTGTSGQARAPANVVPGPRVPSSQQNPLKPGVRVSQPANNAPVRLPPGQSDHTIRGFSHSFPGSKNAPGMVPAQPPAAGFTGRVAR
ncbi:polar tube protein 3 [Encephalitozoon romaleae SJ-2008]|uniref:Polar tube protein 3 n=1 Tax=Encephalitozoon romaleae (strain SJ-2008) TaxID=1178016 RepID=I7AQF8_ENCRO|nr:polar tube protein 3 [Encephalitozoon romaleae SJ-2008]AFN84114.1 polar tube protein 3 [Encephalitozoon romaleae SJ-2008]